jgi:hypothetical protein
MWFDLEYGGPLKWTESGAQAVAAHTDWSAIVSLALPDEEADAWRERAGWDHPHAAAITSAASARPSPDLILHAARLARGLTLLTQGTAFDVVTAQHANPSDWTDRRLERFDVGDHVAVLDGDVPDGRQWFYTRGLRRFGLDELEYFHPRGLTAAPARTLLLAAAGELIGRRQPTNVGATIALLEPAVTIQIVRHRTVPLGEGTLIVREIQRDPQ